MELMRIFLQPSAPLGFSSATSYFTGSQLGRRNPKANDTLCPLSSQSCFSQCGEKPSHSMLRGSARWFTGRDNTKGGSNPGLINLELDAIFLWAPGYCCLFSPALQTLVCYAERISGLAIPNK
ncbi:hypothetical protein RRG08_047033 [Elysia crispata]|uniref:Uncharacterized protein n=1 Tax=Elysia crispata TaxID=231223 RepID=A0AAE1AXM2_9GAST|nr:hypothetical protein RRG08_047033 [Elysia crispata]